jgi:hypothetical protein
MTRIGLVGALISGLAMSACGGGDESDGSPLLGKWSLERPDGCVLALGFGEGGEFRSGEGCALTSGQVGVERYNGSFVANGDRLELYYDEGTCDVAPWMTRLGFEVRGDQLYIDGADGRLVLERIEDDGDGSASIVYGCWEGDSLVFMDLRALE